MNIFMIPSWYPSESNPIYGTFNQEQARILAGERPKWSIGVSRWGQGDERFLLRAADWKSIPKAFKTYEIYKEVVSPNFTEYFAPAFIWTRKFRKGNIKGIIAANRINLAQYTADFGKPDIISAQASYPASIIARQLSREFGIPYIVMIQMSPFPFSEFLAGKRKITPLIYDPLQEANLLLASSKHLEETMNGYGLRKIARVNYAIDTDLFKPATHATPAGTTVILSVGRMEDQKGIDLLIKSLVGMKLPDQVEFRMVGDGSLLEEYQALSVRLGVDENIKWTGALSRERVAEEMRACSFFVLPSRHETFGNVVLEAMATGKPVVVTRCGGPEDFVNEQYGLICEPEVKEIRTMIEQMIIDYTSYDAQKIRKGVMRQFGPEAWVNRMEEVFTHVTPSLS